MDYTTKVLIAVVFLNFALCGLFVRHTLIGKETVDIFDTLMTVVVFGSILSLPVIFWQESRR